MQKSHKEGIKMTEEKKQVVQDSTCRILYGCENCPQGCSIREKNMVYFQLTDEVRQEFAMSHRKKV